jgi:SAM-dependent methyltransferase
MAQYAARGRGDGVKNGGRALRALAREIGGALVRRGGERVCTHCGWSGERFGPVYYFDQYREDTLCYACGSTDRARLLPLYYETALAGFFASGRRRVLDIGSLASSRRFFPPGVDYVSFDLYAPHAMVRGDICAAPFPDASFDLWVCFHVLDLVEDDELAMRELFRLLVPGGFGLLDNAMNWAGPTEEYGRARPEMALHRRRYGTDLLDKLARIGFEVEIVDVEEAFDAETRARYGIHPRRFLLCRKPSG